MGNFVQSVDAFRPMSSLKVTGIRLPHYAREKKTEFEIYPHPQPYALEQIQLGPALRWANININLRR